MLVRPSKRTADATESTMPRRLGFLRPVTLVAMLLAMMVTLIGPNDVFAAKTLLPPVFSVPHGLKTTSFQLTLTSPSGGSIRYTLDGTAPGSSFGTQYSGPITINKTTVVRAIAYSGANDSYVATQSYIFIANTRTQAPGQVPPSGMGWPKKFAADADTDPLSGIGGYYPADYEVDPDVVNRYSSQFDGALKALPTMSMVTDQPNLWDPDYGIYYNSNAKEGLPVDPFNPASDTKNNIGITGKWERPVSLEWIDPNGVSTGFSVNAGIRINGQGSRRPKRTPKKSFKVYFKTAYGNSKLDFNMFDYADSVSKFDRIVIRNGGNRSYPYFDRDQRRQADYINDEWARRSWLQMGNLAPHGTYVHLYINGLYWGLYNVTERVDENFVSSYEGGASTDYDMFESDEDLMDDPVADAGTIDAWYNLLSKVAGETPITDAQYQEIEQLVDVENLADYFLHTHYIGKTDWPHHNWNAYRYNNMLDTKGDHRIKFISWDNDSGMNKIEANVLYLKDIKGSDNSVTGRTPYGINDSPSRIFERLMSNAEFRQVLIDRFYKHVEDPNGALTKANCISLYNQLAGIVDTGIIGESARWGDYVRDTLPHTNSTLLLKNLPAYLHTYDANGLTEENLLDPTHEYTNTDQLSWKNVITGKLTDFCVNRSAALKLQYQAVDTNPNSPTYKPFNWYPDTLKAPVFSQAGGKVPANYALSITNPAANAGRGDIYYTIDGKDPRLEFGALSPLAINGADLTNLTVSQVMIIKARIFDGTNWSPMVKYTFYPPQPFENLSISEIHYSPTLAGLPVTADPDDYEFVELYNKGTTPIRMDNVYFEQGITYDFSEETTIWPGQRLVLASKKSTFRSRYGYDAFDSYRGNLSGLGETVELNQPRNPNASAYMSPGTPIDIVSYLPTAPWPTGANGQLVGATGASLCAPDANADNSLPASWKAGAPKGTPGMPGCDTAVTPTSGIYLSSGLTFGDQPVDQASLPQLVTIANPGALPLALSSIVAAGEGDFTQTNDCPASLKPSKYCTASVVFTPKTQGARSGALNISDNAPNAPHSVALSGTGIGGFRAVSLSSNTLTFGDQIVGTPSLAQSVTFNNTGSLPVAITGIQATGDFAQTNDCGANLAAGASCTINVVFTPTAGGARSGSVTISDNAPGTPHVVNLSGAGVGGSLGLSLSATSLSFDSLRVGATSPVKEVKVTNTSTSATELSITVSAGYAQTNDCPASLAPGASCTISVTFSPTVVGSQAGALTINTSAAGGPFTVSLSGIGLNGPGPDGLYRLFLPSVFH